MKKIIFCLLISPLFCKSQPQVYEDSLNKFIQQYVKEHEVVKGEDKKMMQFYPPDKAYRLRARFERKENSEWFWMNTSGTMKQQYRVYGVLSFIIQNTALQLNVYQNKSLITTKEYGDYLFVPFTDSTSGFETYGGGRYIDLKLADIQNIHCAIDFNKAYNPYCAYEAGYNCPIPPKENGLKVSIKAGEKNFLKH
ncbi:MAG: DUF1684 domain-containing protein [Chitinophagaceae bacterium]|nr:DUF1684 domain-containing protein [Chitinophagaceae bacterium]